MRNSKIDTQEFIRRAINIHGDKYDYSKVDYVNNRTKVQIICNKCGNTFKQPPKNHLQGQGCPKCAFIGKPLENRLERFISTILGKYGSDFTFPNVKDEYKNKKSYITTTCNRCGNVSQVMAEYLVSNHYTCKKCPYLYSYEQLKSITGLDIIPFEGLREKHVEINCKKHGPYKAVIKSILKGKSMCRRCCHDRAVSARKLSPETFKKRLHEKFGDLIVPYIEEFVNTSTPMTFKCSKCGSEFKRQPNNFLSLKLKDPCPECSKKIQTEEKTKTIEDFISDAEKIYGKDAYDFSETVYTNSRSKVIIKCNSCGKTFEKEANSFLQGHGCPYHHVNRSIMEEEICNYITSIYNGEIIENDRKELSGNELDIYLPELKIAIEFDGLFWHSEEVKGKNSQLEKTEQCEKVGIRLIHIFEDEWINKKEIWKSMLRNLIIGDNKKIYARECDIRNVSPKNASKFLSENHIQGKCGSSIKYGLYYNDELVSLMTFGKSRHFVGSGKHQYELLRFCSLKGITVVGGASKLFKHFIKENDPKDVISFADRRWSAGNLYDKIGFKLYNKSKPNYYYIIGTKRLNRFNYRKSVLIEKYNCPKEMSERDFCKSIGLKRIYDCGCLCYIWKKESLTQNV